MKLIVFYHCLFQIGDRLLPNAIDIVFEQMEQFKSSGLLDAVSEFYIGVNGGDEAMAFSELFPEKATVVYHTLACRNELRTMLLIEERVKKLDEQAYILYTHSKGASHDAASDYGKFAGRWRRCMMRTCVTRWRECVNALDQGYEAAGAHWLTGQADGTQHYFAGTSYWTTGKFMKTVPSILLRERIKISGIDSPESRYEAEVALCNGARLPKIKDMEVSHGFTACP